MKNDELYPYYLDYLSGKLNEGKISKGKIALFKLSNSKFEEFKFRFETDELFKSKVIELHKSEIRDKKIDDIFDDFN